MMENGEEEDEFQEEDDEEEDEEHDRYEVKMQESVYSDIVISTLRLEKGKISVPNWFQSLVVLLLFMCVEIALVFFLIPIIAPQLQKSGIYEKAFYRASANEKVSVNLFADYLSDSSEGAKQHP